MQNDPPAFANRMQAPKRPWVWLVVCVSLIVLSGTFAASHNGHESFEHLCSQEPAHHTECLTCTKAGIGAAFLVAGTVPEKSGIRVSFASPAETETPDFDPVIKKSEIAPANAVFCRILLPCAPIFSMGATVPLYLAHLAILC